jgi:hypothetical protein
VNVLFSGRILADRGKIHENGMRKRGKIEILRKKEKGNFTLK